MNDYPLNTPFYKRLPLKPATVKELLVGFWQ